MILTTYSLANWKSMSSGFLWISENGSDFPLFDRLALVLAYKQRVLIWALRKERAGTGLGSGFGFSWLWGGSAKREGWFLRRLLADPLTPRNYIRFALHPSKKNRHLAFLALCLKRNLGKAKGRLRDKLSYESGISLPPPLIRNLYYFVISVKSFG